MKTRLGSKTQMKNPRLINLRATKVVSSFFLKSWTRVCLLHRRWCNGLCLTQATPPSPSSWRLPACVCRSLSHNILSSALLRTWPCTCACLTSFLPAAHRTCTEISLSSTLSTRAWCHQGPNQCYLANRRGTITTRKGKIFLTRWLTHLTSIFIFSFRLCRNPHMLIDIERADLELTRILSTSGVLPHWPNVCQIRYENLNAA